MLVEYPDNSKILKMETKSDTISFVVKFPNGKIKKDTYKIDNGQILPYKEESF